MNRHLWLLAICQGLFLTNNVTFIAINGLGGLALAPLGWMATLPVMGYVVGGALSTSLVARSQTRWGRQVSFQIGLAVAVLSCAVAAWAIVSKDFWLLVGATVVAGYYSANGQLYRFAAAELASPDRDALLDHLTNLQNQIGRRMDRSLSDHIQRLDWLAARLIHPADRIAQRRREMEAYGNRLHHALRRQTEHCAVRLQGLGLRHSGARPRPEKLADGINHLQYRLTRQTQWAISQYSGKLNSLASSLIQLDPHAVLSRGYTLAIGPDGRAIRDATRLSPGELLKLRFASGAAEATVNKVVANPEAD